MQMGDAKGARKSMKINVCTGYPLSSPKGNSVTAKRMVRLFEAAGHQATAMHTNEPPPADVIISLHALKTSAATLFFAKHNPDAKVLVLLTGTDINGGIESKPELAQRVLELADAVVVAQPACLEDLPPTWRAKVNVIYPSIDLPEPAPLDVPGGPLFTNVGHLRPVKNPHLMFRALRHFDLPVTALSIGTDLDSTDGQQATVNMRIDERYRWMGGCAREEATAWIKHSLATINTSFSEGGANTIIEAIHLGTPVLASDIHGNRGLLGEVYAGFFTSDNSEELAALMVRCVEDGEFVEQLKAQLARQKPLFTNQAEVSSWLNLIQSVS